MVPPHEIRKAGGLQSLGSGSLGGTVDLMRCGRGWYHLLRSARPVKDEIQSQSISAVEYSEMGSNGDGIST